MIKRLLLQQATDKRHELERLMRKEKENNPSVAAPAALTKRSLDQFPFAHQQVSVDFPEDALRAFVEKVMEEKINKVSKRCERKLKEQSQVQMDGMLQQMMAEIERRFEDVRSSPLTANPHAQTVKFAQNGMGNRTFVSSLGEAHAPSTANTSRLFGGSLSPFHQYGPISIVKDASHLSSRNGQQ
ncbi:hypothetical protein ADEAN_000291500 [Angomonas deanei]|uniref:Uncharacterized protein n=1 Tax=Angomonas deanei TaxID=59799 RepID=A0A7G2C6P4_9TRYP|nr:hypothetical protein ADEAN_000291500 [Angomonas deanei]